MSRASSTAPGVNEVSTLCVEIATASAPSASAEAGTPGWKPKCPAQAWSQISGMPRACASSAMRATSETTPSHDGSTSTIARASGSAASAASIASTGWPSATPRASSTAGAIHTGRAPESTRPAATDLCEQRETITGSPSEATARQSAWFGCVEPLPEKRQRSAPNAAAASCSARMRICMPPRRSSAPLCHGVSFASSGSSPISAGLRLWPGVEKAVGASRRNASTASAKGVSGAVTSRDAMRTAGGGAAVSAAAHAGPQCGPGPVCAQPVPQSGALSHALSVTSGRGSLPSAFMTRTSAAVAGRGGAEDDPGAVGRVARRADERPVGEVRQLPAIGAVGADREDLRLRRVVVVRIRVEEDPRAVRRPVRIVARVQRPRREPLRPLAIGARDDDRPPASSCRRSTSARARRGSASRRATASGTRSRPGTRRRGRAPAGACRSDPSARRPSA